MFLFEYFRVTGKRSHSMILFSNEIYRERNNFEASNHRWAHIPFTLYETFASKRMSFVRNNVSISLTIGGTMYMESEVYLKLENATRVIFYMRWNQWCTVKYSTWYSFETVEVHQFEKKMERVYYCIFHILHANNLIATCRNILSLSTFADSSFSPVEIFVFELYFSFPIFPINVIHYPHLSAKVVVSSSTHVSHTHLHGINLPDLLISMLTNLFTENGIPMMRYTVSIHISNYKYRMNWRIHTEYDSLKKKLCELGAVHIQIKCIELKRTLKLHPIQQCEARKSHWFLCNKIPAEYLTVSHRGNSYHSFRHNSIFCISVWPINFEYFVIDHTAKYEKKNFSLKSNWRIAHTRTNHRKMIECLVFVLCLIDSVISTTKMNWPASKFNWNALCTTYSSSSQHFNIHHTGEVQWLKEDTAFGLQ